MTTRTTLFTLAVACALATVAKAQDEATGPNTGRIHLSAGVDITNAYFFRGIRQEDENFLVQPWATVSAEAWRGETNTLSLSVGTWNSVHDSGTGTVNDDLSDKWYESDLILGASLTHNAWTFGLSYIAYLSPSDVFNTVQELDFSVAYADSGWLGEDWTLNPSAVLAFETDNAADGQSEGTYLQLSIAPKTTIGERELSLSFPMTVGLSLGDYYQDASGEDETFGFAQVGARLGIPLGMPEDLGSWELAFSAHAILLGDTTKTFNDDDSSDFIGMVSLSMTY